MSTYYDYLKERIRTSSVRDAAQLEELIHFERNGLWQQLVANPAYDERGRMTALAAFDEAASYILSEQNGRFGGPQQPSPSIDPQQRTAYAPEPQRDEPPRPRSMQRDILFFLLGAAVGFAVAYFAGGWIARTISGGATAAAIDIQGLEPAQKSFKFVRSQPSPLEGEINVAYASGARSDTYACEIDATYKQVLEYAKFDEGCKTVTFKFRPLSELWADFNYLEGYMVFSATISAPGGGRWQGSTSVFFSIDGTT